MLECLIQREESVFANYDIRFANQLNLEQEVSAFWDRESKKLKLFGKNDLIHVSMRYEDNNSALRFSSLLLEDYEERYELD